MLHSPLSQSICYQRVLMHISIDETTIADHDYQVTPLHCQYRDGFLTSIKCIQNTFRGAYIRKDICVSE